MVGLLPYAKRDRTMGSGGIHRAKMMRQDETLKLGAMSDLVVASGELIRVRKLRAAACPERHPVDDESERVGCMQPVVCVRGTRGEGRGSWGKKHGGAWPESLVAARSGLALKPFASRLVMAGWTTH